MKFANSMLLAVIVVAGCYGEDPRIRERHDEARSRVWFLTRNGVVVREASRTIRVPLPEWIFAGPRYGCAPDLALGPAGEALVTSDVVPVLWRIDPVSLAVTQHELALDTDNDKNVGFSEIAWLPKDGAYLAASTVDGALWRIDRELRSARKVIGSGRLGSCRSRAGQL